jgi:DNA polymerase III alpha subunit
LHSVYQEQLMRGGRLAGYPSESDELRSAISKKKKGEIEKHRRKFVEGAVKQGMNKATAESIFANWEEFARYGFNKSHAADYGVIAVQTAYLKLTTLRVHGGAAFRFRGRDGEGGPVCGGRSQPGRARSAARHQQLGLGF